MVVYLVEAVFRVATVAIVFGHDFGGKGNLAKARSQVWRFPRLPDLSFGRICTHEDDSCFFGPAGEFDAAFQSIPPALIVDYQDRKYLAIDLILIAERFL